MARKTSWGIAALCAAICVSTAQASSDAQFAFVRANAKGEIRLYSAKPIEGTASVLAQYPGPDGQPTCCKRFKAAEFQRVEEPETIATDEATDEPLLTYLGQLPSGWSRHPFIGTAAVGTGVQAEDRLHRLEMKQRGAKTLAAELCTSQEGLHLHAAPSASGDGRIASGSSDKGDKAEKSVHLYLWMGYEIANPTCRP